MSRVFRGATALPGSLNKGSGTQNTGLNSQSWDQQHPLLTVAPMRIGLGGCQGAATDLAKALLG